MPDSTTPASQMIRVPTPLIDAVKELSRLHRQGHTRAVLTGLQQLLSSIDNTYDSATIDDSSIDSGLISRIMPMVDASILEKLNACVFNHMEARQQEITRQINDRIAEQLAPLQEQVSHIDSRFDSGVIAKVIATAIAPIQEKVAQNEKTTTSIETSNILASEISKLNERVGILERRKLDTESISANILNANGSVADTPANLDARQNTDTAQASTQQMPVLEDLADVQETSLEVETGSTPTATVAMEQGNQAPGASPVKKLELPIGAGLTREEFLQRLRVKNPKLNETTVWRNREGKEKDYTKNRNHFLEWTKLNDPLGYSWEYRCSLSINQPSYFRVA